MQNLLFNFQILGVKNKNVYEFLTQNNLQILVFGEFSNFSFWSINYVDINLKKNQ